MHGLNHIITPWTDDKKAEAIRLYGLDYSYSQIGALVGRTRSAVGSLIKRNGLTKDPKGARRKWTEAELSARAERCRRRQRADSRMRREKAKATGARLEPRPFKARVAIVAEPLNLTLNQISRQFCAYPVNDDMSAPLFCGHGVGIGLNGKPSSYCQGHHGMTHS